MIRYIILRKPLYMCQWGLRAVLLKNLLYKKRDVTIWENEIVIKYWKIIIHEKYNP